MNKLQRMKGLREFLEWFITPQNEEEQSRFKNIVDDYIELKLRITFLTEKELIEELNNQLSAYDLEFNGFENDIIIKDKRFTQSLLTKN